MESRWPECFQCPHAKEANALDGSLLTDNGRKVSYHVVFPWLIFQQNDGALKDIMSKVSKIPDLQYQ